MISWKREVLFNLLYSIGIAFVFMLMDVVYAMSNSHFIFEFTLLEWIKKMALVVLFISIISKRKIRLTFLLLLIFFSFFQYLHFEYFGKNIGGIEFYLFATNIYETFETLNTMLQMLFLPSFIAGGAFLLVYFLELKLSHYLFNHKYGFSIGILVLLFLGMHIFYLTNLKEGKKLEHTDSKRLYPMVNRHSSRNFFVSLNYFTFGILPKKISGKDSVFPSLEEPKLIEKDINRTIVFVIGESLRYDTFSIENKFTPKLQSLKSDKGFFFKKIYSGGTVTKVSISTLINRLKYPASLTQIAEEKNCLFRLATKNNFKTYFYSAQGDVHLQMLRDMICPKYIDSLIDRDDFSQYIEPTGYDEDILRLVKRRDVLKENTFLLLHQRGSHSPYEKQYPKAFNRYQPYENTALYNDYNLYELIRYLKEKIDGEFFLIYVSDHGELLGENGKHGHGHLEKEVYEVPLLMYTNTEDSTLKNDFKRLQSHYDLSNYLMKLFGYKVDENRENRDIYILNSDLDGFSGYGVIHVKDGEVSEIEKKKY